MKLPVLKSCSLALALGFSGISHGSANAPADDGATEGYYEKTPSAFMQRAFSTRVGTPGTAQAGRHLGDLCFSGTASRLGDYRIGRFGGLHSSLSDEFADYGRTPSGGAANNQCRDPAVLRP
jgi:hypothetical protein